MLIAADGEPVSGRDLMAAVYMRGEPWTEWRWRDVRISARRWAVPVLKPRARPLRWRIKPGQLLRQQLAEEGEAPENGE
jgi:hypothetical protein